MILALAPRLFRENRYTGFVGVRKWNYEMEKKMKMLFDWMKNLIETRVSKGNRLTV